MILVLELTTSSYQLGHVMVTGRNPHPSMARLSDHLYWRHIRQVPEPAP